MAIGRCVSDLDRGDVLGPVEYTMSRFVVREYCHAVEMHQPCFQGCVDPVAPPTLVHLDKLRLYRYACPLGTGPHARVHYEYDATIHAPVYAGTRLSVKGGVTDRYVKRGRDYVVLAIDMRAADDGRLLIAYRDTVILAYRQQTDGANDAAASTRPSPGAAIACRPPSTLADAPFGPGLHPARVDVPGGSAAASAASVGAHPAFAAGTEFRLAPRLMTRERMRWYVDIQDTVQFDDGRIHAQPPTIHDDDAYAKKQGLPGIIADGMISTNWILCLLVDVFGVEAAQKGQLRTKYIAPIYEDQVVVTCARVASAHAGATAETIYELEVWCEDATGKKLTVGEALVHSSRR